MVGERDRDRESEAERHRETEINIMHNSSYISHKSTIHCTKNEVFHYGFLQ